MNIPWSFDLVVYALSACYYLSQLFALERERSRLTLRNDPVITNPAPTIMLMAVICSCAVVAMGLMFGVSDGVTLTARIIAALIGYMSMMVIIIVNSAAEEAGSQHVVITIVAMTLSFAAPFAQVISIWV